MKYLLALIISFGLFLGWKSPVMATPALGIHLLDPNELLQAADLAQGTPQNPGAVTVVLRADDHNLAKWQKFFDLASTHNIVPVIRLATTMETEVGQQPRSTWRRPTQKDLVHHATFLNFLNWHRDSLPIIAFNEPNHSKEWGGAVDPENYGEILDLTLDTFHSKSKQFIVMAAGLDAAAPNGTSTMDSFTFLERMLAARPNLASKIDAWTSHSYPNPGFVGSPQATGKNSVKGFVQELAFMKKYSRDNLDVYITETGWKSTPNIAAKLPEYYSYTINNVWNDSRIKAVTPFLFAASTGPFQAFSFTNPDGSPTPQYETLKNYKQTVAVSTSLAAQ